MNIKVEKNLSDRQIKALGIKNWPVWTKERSAFAWSYDATEACYFLEGEAIITTDGSSAAVTVGKGDYVVFPKGLSCTWNITKDVAKHYTFLES